MGPAKPFRLYSDEEKLDRERFVDRLYRTLVADEERETGVAVAVVGPLR